MSAAICAVIESAFSHSPLSRRIWSTNPRSGITRNLYLIIFFSHTRQAFLFLIAFGAEAAVLPRVADVLIGECAEVTGFGGCHLLSPPAEEPRQKSRYHSHPPFFIKHGSRPQLYSARSRTTSCRISILYFRAIWATRFGQQSMMMLSSMSTRWPSIIRHLPRYR